MELAVALTVDGEPVDAVADTVLLTVRVGDVTRPMTDAEVVMFAELAAAQAPDPGPSLSVRLDAALELLRGITVDGAVSDVEVATAVPQVLAALEDLSGTAFDLAQTQQMLRIVARICEALLIRGQQSQGQVTAALAALTARIVAVETQLAAE